MQEREKYDFLIFRLFCPLAAWNAGSFLAFPSQISNGDCRVNNAVIVGDE